MSAAASALLRLFPLALALVLNPALLPGAVRAQVQVEQITDRFSSGINADPHTLTTYFDGSVNHLCFAARSALDGEELFCYDGSALRQVSNIGGAVRGSRPISLTVYDDGTGPKLHFTAQGPSGKNLYAYDGSVTRLAANLSSKDIYLPLRLTVYDDGSGPSLFVIATNGTSGFELFRLRTGDGPLPVELAALEGRIVGDRVQLTWQTLSETNNAGFEVQRRVDATPSGAPRAWSTIGYREGAGTTTAPRTYRFADADLPYAADTLHYRLRQTDTDGTVHVSAPIAVERGPATAFRLEGTFPNPARSWVTIRYTVPAARDGAPGGTLRLYDLLGRAVRILATEERAGRHETRMSVRDLASGVYVLG